MTATATYEPFGAAKAMLHCRAKEVLIEGPAGTGKSRAVLTKGHIACDRYPGARVLAVRETRASMTESVLVTYEQKVCRSDAPWIAGASRRVRQSYTYPNGSVFALGGMDNVDRIMSTEWDLILVFEATELTESDFETLTTRLRNGRMPYQQIIADCNPSYPEHWLNKRFPDSIGNDAAMDRAATAQLRRVRLLSRHEDNPSVTAAYLETLASLSGPRKARLCDGKWAAAEGLVYDNFDRAIHVVKRFDIPRGWRRIRAIDFGYTNPFVCQWWAIDGDGRMYLYREMYMSGRLVADHAEQIKLLSEGESYEATVADHDAEDRETLHRAGIFTIPAIKAVQTGIQAVHGRLSVAGDGKPRLFILADSTVERDQRVGEAGRPTSMVSEMDSYVWQDVKDGRAAKEEPLKVNDHGVDAARYAVSYVDRGMPGVGWVDGASKGAQLAKAGVSHVAEQLDNDDLWEAV